MFLSISCHILSIKHIYTTHTPKSRRVDALNVLAQIKRKIFQIKNKKEQHKSYQKSLLTILNLGIFSLEYCHMALPCVMEGLLLGE